MGFVDWERVYVFAQVFFVKNGIIVPYDLTMPDRTALSKTLEVKPSMCANGINYIRRRYRHGFHSCLKSMLIKYVKSCQKAILLFSLYLQFRS